MNAFAVKVREGSRTINVHALESSESAWTGKYTREIRLEHREPMLRSVNKAQEVNPSGPLTRRELSLYRAIVWAVSLHDSVGVRSSSLRACRVGKN